MRRKTEEEENNNKNNKTSKKFSPFEHLINDLVELCKDPISGVLMEQPTSLPSGNVYNKSVATSILKGRYKKFNEPRVVNKFRKDNFTNKLIKIVQKYQKKKFKN